MKRTVNVYAICAILAGLFFFESGIVSAQVKWALGSSGAGSGPYVWGGGNRQSYKQISKSCTNLFSGDGGYE